MKTVLIADDEICIREGLRDVVDWKSLNIRVAGVAEDGKQAYDMAMALRPDIIVSDVVMPGMTGFEMATRLREAHSQAEFVMISAYQEFEYYKSAFRINAVDYILKPINMAEFMDVMHRVSVKLPKVAAALPADAAGANGPPAADKPGSIRLIIRNICDHIEGNLGEHLTIAVLADRFYLSPNYLCALFHKEVGMTINDYITNSRMETARRLLGNPSLYINEIAHMVGYADPGYFSRMFRKQYGITPYEFRESETSQLPAGVNEAAK